MEETYQFPLINVAKYSKSHYNRTGDFWYDVALCLHADDYGPFFGYSHHPDRTPSEECYRERRDMTELIIDRIQKVLVNKPYRLKEITRNSSPEDCWRVGFYCKGNMAIILQERNDAPEYEYWQAVLRAHLSELSMSTATDLGYDNWDKFHGDNIPELNKDRSKEEKELLNT